MLDDVLTSRIAVAKQHLLEGGLLQAVSWGVPVGERDERGRITYSYSDLDAFIEDRPALDRAAIDTDRSDEIVVIILDPVAIDDEDLFRFGNPIHVYKIKAIDGLIADELTGTRYSSEMILIR